LFQVPFQIIIQPISTINISSTTPKFIGTIFPLPIIFIVPQVIIEIPIDRHLIVAFTINIFPNPTSYFPSYGPNFATLRGIPTLWSMMGNLHFGGYLNSIYLGSPPSLIIPTILITTREQQQLEVAMNNH
jgi:hypothetical protein